MQAVNNVMQVANCSSSQQGFGITIAKPNANTAGIGFYGNPGS